MATKKKLKKTPTKSKLHRGRPAKRLVQPTKAKKPVALALALAPAPAPVPPAPDPGPTATPEQVVEKAREVSDALAAVTPTAPPSQLASALPADALAIQTTINELGAQVSLFTFTPDTAKQGAEMLTQLKALEKRLETARLKQTKPLKDAAKRIEALFKPITDKLEKFDQQLRAKFLTYMKEQQEKQKEEQKALLASAQQAQASGDTETAVVLATQAAETADVAKTTVVDTGSVQMKRPWDFKVVDAGKVPEEYKTIDEAKIRAAIRAGMRDEVDEQGNVTRSAIPGIAIYQRDSLAVSAGPLEG